jgi:hypothetical protein
VDSYQLTLRYLRVSAERYLRLSGEKDDY